MDGTVDETTGEILIASPDTALTVQKYAITPTGLQITGALTLDEWIECGSQIVGIKNAIQWCIGDWMVHGEGRGNYGETYAQAEKRTLVSYGTLANATYVAKRFKFSRRRENLSWSHHYEVAGIDDDAKQDRLLDVAEARDMSREEFREYLKSIKVLAPLHSSNSVEWYTPKRYIESAREVMEAFDLDPASCAAANRTVQAETYYTAEDDGLVQDWYGRVWLNPPYGHNDQHESNQGVWAQALIDRYERGDVNAAILLVSANTSEQWFQPLWNYTMCFTDHRINFDAPEDQKKSGANHGSVLVYFGEDVNAFAEVFAQHGRVVIPDVLYSKVLT